jgi:hypothetical protein
MDDKLKSYNELLNISTAKYIVKALCDYEDLKIRTSKSINNKIHIVFLFSGVKPDCEYEICRKIKDLIPESNIFITLVDINQPDKDSIYFTNKADYGIDKIETLIFSQLNWFYKVCPKRFIPNTYFIGIHPQHNDPSKDKKKLNMSSSPYKIRNYTSNEKDMKFGMYDFFNNCWINKKVLYAFRGNPEYTTGEIVTNSSLSVEFKPPVVVIFCVSENETEKYIDIYSVFEKGKSIFNLPKDEEGLIKLNDMTVKDNSVYVYDACNHTQSAGYKKKHSKTKSHSLKIKHKKNKTIKHNTIKHNPKQHNTKQHNTKKHIKKHN